MPSPFDPFFPAGPETWAFTERGSGLAVPVAYKPTRDGDRTQVALDLPDLPAYFNAAFFDRMTLTPAGLELNRIRLNAGATISISPPLVVTPDPHEANAVAGLFPPGTIAVLNDQPPFAGKVTDKSRTDLGGGKQQFELRIVATAQFGEKVFRVERMQFQTGRGLTDYRGLSGGTAFVYERQA